MNGLIKVSEGWVIEAYERWDNIFGHKTQAAFWKYLGSDARTLIRVWLVRIQKEF